MLKQIGLAVAMSVAALSATAGEFVGVFEGLSNGMVSVSGKSYPLKPDVMAQYDGRLVAVDLLPAGIPVSFDLGQFAGVSAITAMEITQVSDTLDEMFPPH